ncbi:FUSC family protein, partial [Actinocorallia longicatena]|uniref:FUSC family protein n=1 Tax=Actinocorallia longicatena TaxID=111803 RepID=UPI0031CDFCD8
AAFAGKGGPPGPLAVPEGGPAHDVGAALEGTREALAGLSGGEVAEGWTSTPGERLRAGFTTADPVTRGALRLGLACLLTAAVSVLFGIGKVYWSVFAAVMVLATPPGLVRARMWDRLLGTLAGVLLAGVLVPLTGDARGLQLVLGLLFILPGILLMPINYGWTCFFVATAVGLLYGGIGDQGDFFHFRLLENLVGCAVIVLVMGLTWRSDPWPAAAARLLRGTADALRSSDPAARLPDLRGRALVLRDAAADRAAGSGETAAVWTFGSAAVALAVLATEGAAIDPDRLDLLADRLFTPGPLPEPEGNPADPIALELERLTAAVRALAET